MSSRSTGIANAAVRAWVRVYTSGLPHDLRRARRELIESDLYEQCADEAPSALAVFSRGLRGVLDDVVWRATQRTTTETVGGSPIGFPAGGGAMSHSRAIPRQTVLLLVTGLSLALMIAILVHPVAHSLAIAGLWLTALALAGWQLEGAPPDEENEPVPEPSVWPLAAAAGLAVIAAGVVVSWPYAGAAVAAPIAASAALVCFGSAFASIGPAVSSTISPLPQAVLAAHAAAGAAIAIEQAPAGRVSRRGLLRTGLWLAMGTALAAAAGSAIDFLWERRPEGFGGIIPAGTASDYKPGSKTLVREGRFWLVSLTEEQGGPGFLALWRKCPHLGCTVPYLDDFVYADPATKESRRGWFRCPCHGSTYDDAGVRVAGPAPRSMDRMDLAIDPESGAITVNTGKISNGAPDNAEHAVKAPPPLLTGASRRPDRQG